MTAPTPSARRLEVADVATAVIDTGTPEGAAAPPALLLHGSGPGVTAIANWRAAWTDHALALLDTLGIGTVDIVGNSMGGAIGLSIAAARPQAVRRLVLMGSVGWRWPSPRAGQGPPVLMVHGRDDRVVPWRNSSAQLVDLLGDARLHVLSGCGHWTMIERTADFLAVVQPFLAG